MKNLSLLSLLWMMMLVLAGCGVTETPSTPTDPHTGSQTAIDESTGDVEQDPDTVDTSSTGWSLTSSEYTIELLSGDDILDIYADAQKLYTITHNPTQRRTYLVVSDDPRDETITQRNSHIMDDMTPTTGNLSDTAFASYHIAWLDWYQIAVPVDRVLLVHEGSDNTFVLDFDDPSGLQHTMSLEDVETMLEYFVIE